MVARHACPTGDDCVIPNALLQACGRSFPIHALKDTEHPKVHLGLLVRARLTEAWYVDCLKVHIYSAVLLHLTT